MATARPTGSGQGLIQRLRDDGECDCPHLLDLLLTGGAIRIEQAHSADGFGFDVLLREHLADLDRDRPDRGKIEPQSLVRMLLLVLPLLPGGRSGGGSGGNHKSERGMANFSSRSSADLLGISLLSSLPWSTGSGEGTSRGRE